MPEITTIETERLVLVPITVDDAPTLVAIFADPDVARYIGGDELTREVLAGRFERMPGGSGRPDEIWMSWTVRVGGTTVGLAQATVRGETAELAWVVGRQWQRSGYATEAASAVMALLSGQGTQRFEARMHPDNAASRGVAAKLGLIDTGAVDEDGEMVFERL